MIYLCGDSFGVADSEYGTMWADMIKPPHTNLCRVAASNLAIAAQVDTAIAAGADWICVFFTTSTRCETRIKNQIISWSWHTASETTTPFTKEQLHILREYYAAFGDLELSIYQNSCIIQSVLYRLEKSGIKYIWDQGGFEHSSMGGKPYFTEFNSTRSALCLWDYARTRAYRPYYHITDLQVHKRIAYYYNGVFE